MKEEKQESIQKKHNIKKHLLTVLIALLLITGVITMFMLYTDTDNKLAVSQQRVEDLQNEVKQLKSASEETETTEDKMVVVFTPGGLFDEAEKQEISEKLINPLEDYERDVLGNNPLTMEVEKDQDSEGYIVSVIFDDGLHSGLLYGQSEPLEWWKPTCLNECAFTDDYAEKYPEVVK